MQLVPFAPQMAEFFLKYYTKPEYFHFSRGVRRILNLDELAHLPQVLGMEVFAPLVGEEFVGAVCVSEEAWGVYSFGIAVDKEHQRKGYSYEIEKCIADYVFKKKGGRILITEVIEEDEAVARSLINSGYTCVGTIPKFHFVDGDFKNVKFFYKHK